MKITLLLFKKPIIFDGLLMDYFQKDVETILNHS